MLFIGQISYKAHKKLWDSDSKAEDVTKVLQLEYLLLKGHNIH